MLNISNTCHIRCSVCIILIINNFISVSCQNLQTPCSVSFLNCPSNNTVTLIDCDNSGDEVVVYPLLISNPAGDCTNFNIIQSLGPSPGTLAPVGQYLINFFASAFDINSQQQTSKLCVFYLKVEKDLITPVFINCPPNITVQGVFDTNGNCSVPAYWTQPVALDNCSTSVALSPNSKPCGSSFPAGTQTITYIATDPTGNTSVCTFTVTVNCISSNNEVVEEAFPLRIYPNPNPGLFTLELPLPATTGMRLRISDPTGRLLQDRAAEPGLVQQTIEANELPNGLYFLQVLQDGKVLGVERFVKQE